MAVSGKLLAVGSTIIALGLFFGVGGYKAWSLMSIRMRPWHLEAYVQSRLADCRTGPGVSLFREEGEKLAARFRRGELCLSETGRKVWFRRDYSECISMLLSAGLDAQLLSWKLEQRQQEQKKKLEALLPILSQAILGNGRDNKIWARFDMRSTDEDRARSLLEEAQFLYAHGETEAAFTSALRAWASWNHFSLQSDSKFSRFSDPTLLDKWEQHVEQLLKWTKRSGRRAILIDKLEHLCLLIHKGQIQKRYVANLGRKWYERKTQAKDASTPEGEYKVTRLIPRGKYGFALMLDYPNAEDRTRFQALKRDGTIPVQAQIGGNIEIHGRGKPETDWTDGCIALDDGDMRELYGFAYAGMPVTIVGTSHWASGKALD